GGGSNAFVAPFGGSAANLPYVIQAVVEGQHAAEQQYYLILSVVALAILSLASVLIGWFVAGRVLRPLRTMAKSARTISSTNLELRLAPTGPDDELKDLGESFDDLLGRLEQSFETQRQFVANASHELRPPLARERAHVRGDPHLLERLVANLVENAARYNVPDGEIEVTTEMQHGEAFLRVTNSGPLIPPPDVDQLFEPFRRLQPDRTTREGWGLG